MKRKVIKLAQNTLVVSLPSEWAKKFGVCKGDELEVLQDADALVIRSSKPVSVAKELVLDISSASPGFVKSLVSVVHKLGFDHIEFVSRDSKLLDVVRQRVDECIGFEVVRRSDMCCVVQCVAGDTEQSLEAMVRRTFFVTMQMAKLLAESTGQSFKSSEMLALEQTNNRLSNYCHRLLNRQSKGAHTSLWYILVWLLESIGDEYRDLALHQSDSKLANSSQIFREIEQHLRGLHEYVFSGSFEGMDALRKENKELRQRIEFKLKVGEDVVMWYGLQSIVQRTYDCFGSATGIQFLRRDAKD